MTPSDAACCLAIAEPRSPFGPPALQRHSVGSMPLAAMSLPEGHAMNFPQLPPTSGPTLQHQGSLSGGFSFRSSPQLLGSLVRSAHCCMDCERRNDQMHCMNHV